MQKSCKEYSYFSSFKSMEIDTPSCFLYLIQCNMNYKSVELLLYLYCPTLTKGSKSQITQI